MDTHDFKPAWWLNSPHLQTIFPTVFPRHFNLVLKRERLELPDTDFLDLDWIGENNQDIVLILHGLAGSSTSPYVQGIMNSISHRGWKCVLMHFRGCSGEPNRLARSYHSGETEDLAFVINVIKNRYPNARLSVVGYSLGGNVLLKWLGETKINDFIKAAVAVSVPFDLSKVVDRIQKGPSRVYQWWLLKKLKMDILKKKQLTSLSLNPMVVKNIKTFRDFDQLITAPLHGFKGADEYYLLSSSKLYLKDIQVPTLIIHSLDDPFMTPTCIPPSDELSHHIKLELHQSGGHVGFISGNKLGKPIYWLEERIPTYLQKYFTNIL